MPDTQAGSAAAIGRVVAMFQEAMPAERTGSLAGIREGFEQVLAQLPIRDDAVVTPASYGGVDGYWVQVPDAADDRVGVMLHGGGFVMGSAKGYRAFAAEISGVTGARVFVPEYRLAPEHPFPAGMEDACSVLDAAIGEVGPESCFAIGDSAGGGLVISSLWERHRTGKPLPACIVLVSALIDLTVSNPSFQERASVDPICAQAGTRRNASYYLDGKGPEEAPAAFPMLLELGWLPPSLVLVGGAEVLRDDSHNLAVKLEREGAHVEYHEYEAMVHVWPLFSSFLPEGQQALEEIRAFVSAQTSEQKSGSTDHRPT